MNGQHTIQASDLLIDHITTASDDSKHQSCLHQHYQHLKCKRKLLDFHHIFSGQKQRHILALANDLHLSDVMKTGRPGVILIEGESSHIDCFVATLKRWQWRRMTQRYTQE